MSEFKKYRRVQIAELRPYIKGESLTNRVSISQADMENGSPKEGDMIARNPKNHDDQWLVAKQYFEDNFTVKTTDLTFGDAIEFTKQGKKVARAGWNGKGMWIALGQGNPSLPSESFWNKHSRSFAEQNGGTAEVLPYILFKTADNKILMGWLASQTDMLSEDWMIVE